MCTLQSGTRADFSLSCLIPATTYHFTIAPCSYSPMYDSAEKASHYHTVSPKLCLSYAFHLEWHLAGLGVKVV
jgi:hypothetical protein